METIENEIRAAKSVNLINEFKTRILDTAKNIKSNDLTFKTKTLNEVSGDLTRLMTSYHNTLAKLKATEATFLNLIEDVLGGQETDTSDFKELFEAKFDQNFRDLGSIPADSPHLVQLNSIIRPEPQNQDEEIVVEASAEKVWPKDPITKTPIQKAVRNKICNHIYDKKSIQNYIEQRTINKQRVACPVAGCLNKNTSSKDLIPDDETNNLIESMRD